MNNNCFSREITVFHDRMAPEKGTLVGYGAIIEKLQLPVPLPGQLVLISEKRRRYQTAGWLVLTPRHKPQETLYGHLVIALKYEGINLLLFKMLFQHIGKEAPEDWIKGEPLGRYSRKIWFLFEWLMQKQLDIKDLTGGNYVPLIDDSLQYCGSLSINSPRHRIRNNFPGTVNFCPLIHKTHKLENFIQANLPARINSVFKGVHKDLLLRTSAFLMLKDSKASFTIEGEIPTQNRAIRWGRAIGQAGSKPLSKDELLRLQKIVIENSRFVKLGFRQEGGFVGTHDRITGEPLPDHISARWQDLESLIEGLLNAGNLLENSDFNPVLAAANIAFGFVFIHPFEDGNGRIHRYLVHHLLAKMHFTPQGIIFPVSAAILERIDDYRKVLENFSLPLLDFIEWTKTPNNNIEVLNNTIDYYRYFDATLPSEFLYECIDYTINKIIPDEVAYLQKYDTLKGWLDDHFQMADKTVALLIRFLEQNNAKLSKRARDNEFSGLTDDEVGEIEKNFNLLFGQ